MLLFKRPYCHLLVAVLNSVEDGGVPVDHIDRKASMMCTGGRKQTTCNWDDMIRLHKVGTYTQTR